MKKLTKIQIETINNNMIAKETEKAFQLKVNYISLAGNAKEINIWVPKSCTELSECGILKIKDWFLKNKQQELHGYIEPVLNY